jgi:hypothetical protein
VGEIDVINNGGIPFIGPDGIQRTLDTDNWIGPHTIYGGTFGDIWTNFEDAVAELITTEANTAYIMYTATAGDSRFGGGYGTVGNLIAVIWDNDTKSWYTYPNSVEGEHPFVPDADQGDFLVGKIERPVASGGISNIDSWIFDTLPAQTRKYTDGKTVYFVSNTFHGSTEDHKFGPNPSISDNGLVNPEPYGDKWISLSPPYKTYLYFSNATNKIAQTAFHTPTAYALANYANTNWPYGTSNNSTGWYEYRDTGDALSQEGLEVRLHMDSINQVSIGEARWTEDSLTNLINSLITLREDNDGTTPTVDFGDPRDFGETREILLNPVPPPDTNLHAHWTMNSFGVDEAGNLFLPDVSGRDNHAIAGRFTDQSSFRAHNPAENFINISGNHSLFANGLNHANPGAPQDFMQHIVLGANSQVTTLSNEGKKYPIDITKTDGPSGGYNKHTETFWYKPRFGNELNGAIIGQGNARGFAGEWRISLHGNMTVSNNDIDIRWKVDGADELLRHSGPGTLAGWYGANDAGTYTPIRQDEWHFIAVQTNHIDHKQSLWIYREGEGLLYYKTRDTDGTSTAATGQRGLVLNGMASEGWNLGSGNGANGFYDEVRLYNSILTPRNIRYLYMNPTGRPHQLQPRPGIGVKKGYISFFEGNWAGTTGPAGDDSGTAANTYAYFHGFDVDGNPADVDPYISFNGQVKYLTRDLMKMYFTTTAESDKYAGNTGYVMYNDEAPWSDNWNNGSYPRTSPDVRYVFAMPIGANSTQPHTWQYHNYNGGDDAGFIKFTPDESKHFVIGEARLANTVEQSEVSHDMRKIQSVEAYQMARKPSVVRESYNFTITPDDFMTSGGMEGRFFANAAFWASPEGMDATFIYNLVADRIQTGTLTAGVKVGAEAKVTIDGQNSRIVIKD